MGMTNLAVLAELTPEQVTARVFLDIAIVVAVARVFGSLFRRIHQPAVVGEIVAGIMLGPSFLGLFNEDLPGKLFPAQVVPYLAVVANLGLILFMFIVGLEVDIGLIRGKGRLAAVTSVSSVILPFGLGMLAAGVLFDAGYGVVNGEEVDELHFALFIGASMAVTAFPVLARILTERRMQRTRLGVLALACAAVDDVIAWTLLAAVLTVVGESEHSAPEVVVLSLLFAVVMVFAIRPLLKRVVDRYLEHGRLTPDLLAVILIGVLVSAYLTSEIGIHAIFGAFFFGAIFPREGAHQLFHEILERLEQVTLLLLLPVFFVVTGLKVDVSGLGTDGLGYLFLVLVVACVGKFVGASVASRSQGVPTRQALGLGVLMNTRGLTELVILSVGAEAGILNEEMFTIMVVMALFTTIITEPLMRIIYPSEMVDQEIAEAERIGSDLAEAYRVLAGTPDGDPGPLLASLAAELTTGEEQREVALVQFIEPGVDDTEFGPGLALDDLAASLDTLHQLETAVEAEGVPVFARSRTSDQPGHLLGLLADENVVDVVLVPADATYAPPGGSQSPAAPTARLDAVEGSSGLSGAVGARLEGGGNDRPTLDIALRLGAARGTPVRLDVSGSPGRRLSSSLDKLRSAGLVTDRGDEPVAIDVRPGDPMRGGTSGPTLWVQAGRDDGVAALDALVSRLAAGEPESAG